MTINALRRATGRKTGLILLLLWGLSTHLFASEIVDMYGKKVSVPDRVNRVFSISPSVTYLLCAIDPDLVVALNRKPPESEAPYLTKAYRELPVLGGAFGSGLTMNLETLLTLRPDVLIIWGGDGAYDKKTADKIYGMNIPVVSVNIDSLSNYPDAFTLLGKLLHREKRAAELADYARKVLGEVKNAVARIPERRLPSVYNARLKEGLDTACDKSWHAQLIPMAGGQNPVKCTSGDFTGIQKISMEQVLVMDPDVILAMDASFAASVYEDERWRDLRAVKTKRVYLTPREPMNWFDGPPSFMGLLGLQWLTHCLYPDAFPKDMEKETQKFIRLFFRVDLSPDSAKRLLSAR
jgi:iron complex transport system substrate-binding protein